MSDTNTPDSTFDAILRDHANLRRQLDELRKLLFDRTGEFSEVSNRLRQLQELVEGHFRTEEDSGCFGDLVNQAPRVSDKVQALINEHADLSVDMSQIVARASDAPGAPEDWDDVSAQFGEFTAKLMQHEMVENELLQKVFTEDIGSKD